MTACSVRQGFAALPLPRVAAVHGIDVEVGRGRRQRGAESRRPRNRRRMRIPRAGADIPASSRPRLVSDSAHSRPDARPGSRPTDAGVPDRGRAPPRRSHRGRSPLPRARARAGPSPRPGTPPPWPGGPPSCCVSNDETAGFGSPGVTSVEAGLERVHARVQVLDDGLRAPPPLLRLDQRVALRLDRQRARPRGRLARLALPSLRQGAACGLEALPGVSVRWGRRGGSIRLGGQQGPLGRPRCAPRDWAPPCPSRPGPAGRPTAPGSPAPRRPRSAAGARRARGDGPVCGAPALTPFEAAYNPGPAWPTSWAAARPPWPTRSHDGFILLSAATLRGYTDPRAAAPALRAGEAAARRARRGAARRTTRWPSRRATARSRASARAVQVVGAQITTGRSAADARRSPRSPLGRRLLVLTSPPSPRSAPGWAAAALGQRLLPGRAAGPLVGDHRLHRGHRDQHAHVHRRARPRLPRRLALPAARLRLRRRAAPDLRALPARLLPRRALHLLRAAPEALGRPRARLVLRHLPLSRTLADGIRLHAAALVLAVAAGVPRWEWAFILVPGRGHDPLHRGRRRHATIWTDTMQLFVYLAGALVCLVAVIRLLPMAWATRSRPRRPRASCSSGTSRSTSRSPSRFWPA